MGGKKVKGRKRHIVTDIEGHLLHVKVHAANIHDTKAAPNILDHAKEKISSLKGFSADEGYKGTTVDHVEKSMELKIEISKKSKMDGAFLLKDGLWRGLLLGSTIAEEWPKTLRFSPVPLKILSESL